LPVPPRAEREALWAQALGPGELPARLAREHRHAAGRIAHLGRLARQRGLLEGRAHPARDDVLAASRSGDGTGLGGLAQPLPAPVPDEALVAGPALKAELEMLLLRCRVRDGLADGLGVSAGVRYTPGVRALLVGPSGTGKTLAAGWLATRLGLPLYRVDLASVSSKYIGETEKNLAQLLARAEQAEVVLLFDEADSLFGKRTEVRDSNDRFANAQTNYLLQRIESFDGIALLTSNSRTRFDSAFTRRLDAIIEFGHPGPEERRALWEAHLGAGHALEPRDLNRLAATADLGGGHIRNAVLAAAAAAQDAGRAITFADVVQGLTAEYRKLGKHVPVGVRE
ncbi:MAG TPA: ATP-binding protein, partial [Longimicrobium sp.]